MHTDINLLSHPIVNDFVQTHDMWVSQLLHDSNFLANLLLCCVDLVRHGYAVG